MQHRFFYIFISLATVIFCQNNGPADSSLVAWYPFNGNSNDAGIYENHGTNNGAVPAADRFGNDSSAYEFNGTSSYIAIPSSESLKSPVAEITLSAWVYTYNFSLIGASFGPVLMKSNSGTNAFQYRLAVTSAGINFALNNWDTGRSSGDPLNFNTWHYIVAAFKDDSARFYLDGVLVNTAHFPVDIIADDRVLEIGRDVPGITEIFYGKIDDIRIYNRAISGHEIDSLYNLDGWGEIGPAEAQLVAHYSFDGNAEDSSPNNNHGTVYNATPTRDRFGNDSSAWHFDGASSYIDIGSHPTLKMDDAVTIATWVNLSLPLTGGTNWYNVISDHSPSYNNGKIFRFQGNAIEFLLGPEGSMEAKYTFADSASGWHHIATTYDGDSIKIYVDGAKEAAALRQGVISVNPNPLWIGRSGFGEFFTGDMDDLRIYKGALSAQQITELVHTAIVNNPPAAFNLLTPHDGDTLFSISEPVNFSWQRSMDPDGDTLSYQFRLFGDQTDTTISALGDTLLSFNGTHFFSEEAVYNWTVLVSDGIDTVSSDTLTFVIPLITSLSEKQGLPGRYELKQNYPNPFNPKTNFEFQISNFEFVNLSIYNLLGQKVATLIDRKQAAGHYTVQWDASGFSSGIYVYILEVEYGHRTCRKLVLLK